MLSKESSVTKLLDCINSSKDLLVYLPGRDTNSLRVDFQCFLFMPLMLRHAVGLKAAGLVGCTSCN